LGPSNPTHMGRGPQIPAGWPLAGQRRARARADGPALLSYEKGSRVVGVFPNPDVVIRLVGAVLNDVHDECQAGERRCVSE